MNKTNHGNSPSNSTNNTCYGSGKVNGFASPSSQNQKGVNGSNAFSGSGNSSSSSSSSCSNSSSSGPIPKGVPPICPVSTSTSSSGGQRLSYAQVAQHHREKFEMEKQLQSIVTPQPTSTANSHHNNVSNSATVNNQPPVLTNKSHGTNTSISTNVSSFSDNDKKDNSAHSLSLKQQRTYLNF